jgi:hypothetical protein
MQRARIRLAEKPLRVVHNKEFLSAKASRPELQSEQQLFEPQVVGEYRVKLRKGSSEESISGKTHDSQLESVFR